MFEAIQNGIRRAAEAVQAKYDGFTDSVDKLNKDIIEIRDMFVSIKDVIVSIFSFIGQETAILLFCTFLFLFVVNLIPFLFLGKKTRYFIGIGFGVYLSFSFGYAIWSLIKYILVMLSPMLLEYLLVLFFKTTGKSLWILIKKATGKLCKTLAALWKRVFKKTEDIEEKAEKDQKEEKKEREETKKEAENEKQVLKP